MVGIDPDTKKLSLVETNHRGQKKPWVHTIPLPSTNHRERSGFAYRGMCEIIFNLKERDGQLPILYLEEPVMGKGGPGSTIPQAIVQGGIFAAADEYECKIVHVNNSSWKKRICGNGNISKSDIPAVMKEVWPELYEIARGQQDLLDAGAIHLFGRRHEEMVARIMKRRNK